MHEMIRERQGETKANRHDLFNSLLDANNDDDGVKLTESELIGMISTIDRVPSANRFPANIYIFLLAGHEVSRLHMMLVPIEPKWSTDKWTYIMFRVCIIGTLPR